MGKKNRILLAVLAALWVIGFFIFYFSVLPLRLQILFRGFPQQFSGGGFNPLPAIKAVLFGFLILVVAHFLGGALLRSLRLYLMTPAEMRLPLQTLAGLFIVGMITFFLGIAGLLYRWLFILLLIAGLAGAGWFFQKRSKPPVKKARFQSGSLVKVLWILISLFGFLLFLYTLTPTIQSDGLRYHLAAPQEYIKAHRIIYLPHSALSNLPFLIEMLYLAAMLVSDTIAAKFLHFALFVLGGLLVRGFVLYVSHRKGTADYSIPTSPFMALMAAVLFWTVPALSIVSCWSFIDAGVAAYFLCFVFSLVVLMDEKKNSFIILSGIFGGAALGTKYTMIPMVMAGCLMICILLFIEEQKRDPFYGRSRGFWWKSPIGVGIISLISASPWYIKNIIYTGNPFFPMFYGIFGGRNWSAFNAEFYAGKAAGKGLGKSIPLLLQSPFNTTIYWPQFGQFNPGPFLLFSLPFLFLGLLLIRRIRDRRPLIVLYAFATVYYMVWFFGYQSNRFLIPFFGLSAAIIALFLLGIMRQRPVCATIISFGLIFCSLYSGLWSARWIAGEARPRPIPVALGLQHPEDYLTEALDYYSAIRIVNMDVPEDRTVLCIGEHRALYFEPRLIISDWFDTPVILHMIRNTENNSEIFDQLLERDCSAIFFNKGELDKYFAAYFRPRFSEEEFQRFTSFMESVKLGLPTGVGPVYIYDIRFDKGETP